MQPFHSVVTEVENSIASGEDSRRVETLRRLTNLFVEQAPVLGEEHVGVFDEVISRLAHEIEFRARVELAERLADIENAPRRTVRDLAFDENIQIARPVIERSARLAEADLVDIARQRSQSHLLALSGRRHLTEAVTDVLVERGDEQVVRRVAGNETARFSPTGFDTLVQRSRDDDALQAILGERKDLPAHHAATILEAAKEQARRDLAQSMPNRPDIGDILGEALDAGARAVAEGGVEPIDFTGAAQRVDALAAAGPLGEETVSRLLRENKLADALVVISRIANLPADMVANAYTAPNYDPILFIVKGSRLGWPIFKLLLKAKAGKAPPQVLLQSAFASFEALSLPTAQRVMRFVATRSKLTA
jgi:hypothetical protein